MKIIVGLRILFAAILIFMIGATIGMVTIIIDRVSMKQPRMT